MSTRPRAVAGKRKVAAASTRRDAPPSPHAPDLDFLAVLESLPDVVYTLDLEGRFTYLSARAYEIFGYDRADGELFIGRTFMDILGPGTTASAADAIRHRVEFPHDTQLFRVDAKRKNGETIPLEVHGGRCGATARIVGRVGVCRARSRRTRTTPRRSTAPSADGLQGERMRIARGLRDAIAQIVFGVTPDRDASEAFLVDVKRATRADLARRLNLDDVDLDILRLIAGGASNREIGPEVHLSRGGGEGSHPAPDDAPRRAAARRARGAGDAPRGGVRRPRR